MVDRRQLTNDAQHHNNEQDGGKDQKYHGNDWRHPTHRQPNWPRKTVKHNNNMEPQSLI